MSELIYNIKDVFSNDSNETFLNDGEYYNIPEYQRGYKWNKDNVKTLLEDILKFQLQIDGRGSNLFYCIQNIPEYQRGYMWNKDNVKTLLEDILKFQPQIDGRGSDLFYCVQNITLCKHGKSYNVVDGQQRLTTLLIILSYLKETDLVTGKLKYSIREESDEFIKKYIIGRLIWNDKDWEALKLKIDPIYNRKDVFYISEAAFAIQEWFDSNKDKLSIDTILNHVKLIVNDLSDTNEEKIFSNLNGGKVSLDGADLIRAVLMTRVAGEILGNDQNKERINEHRVRIGMELDAINLWWGNRDVATYFKQLLPDKLTSNKLFDISTFPINTLYMLYYTLKGNDEEISFKFFEYGINGNDRKNDDHLEMYQGILKLQYEMQDWFGNREIYHLLGYLFHYFKSSEVTFRMIYKKWENASSKEGFIKELKTVIFQQLIKSLNGDEESKEINRFDEFKNHIKELNSNWYDDQNLFRTLVLMDIIQITRTNNLGFLPVEFFKPKQEDKEHIRPQTPRKDKEESKSKEDWKKFIVDLRKPEQTEIEDILEKSQNEELTDEEINSIHNIINRLGLNSIGNMVLLNLSVNRAYGNACYVEKRREILSNYMEGKYIRPHTLNAFVKKGRIVDLNNWTLDDIQQNAKRISSDIELFFQ
jgi:hypothetical protein